MDETQTIAAFRAKFQVEQLLVAKTAAWSWSVRPAQATLGAGILSLNRCAAEFSQVTAAEMAELAELLARLEKALKSMFAYDRINYLMLMMVDHQVHFHVIPRYATPRQFAGLEWHDQGWPGFPALADEQHRDQEGVQRLLQEVLQAACTP